MKKLKQDLKTVNRELKALVKKTESLMKAVDRIEKAKTAKAKKASPKKAIKAKAVKKVAVKKRSAKPTDYDKAFNIIKKFKRGVSVQALAKKTGFNAKKIVNIVFKANKAGKIRSVRKGVYVGV